MIDNLDVAGTELQLLKLIRGLDPSKVSPFLCLLGGASKASRELEPDHCPVLRLGVRSLHHPSILPCAWQFACFLRSRRIDIVQTYFPDSTYFGVIVARLAGIRHVIRTRRDLGYWLKPVDRWAGWLCGRLAKLTITPCEACRTAVIEQEGVRSERVIVIQNGLDLSSFTEIPPPIESWRGATRRVGMVANLRPVKGPDVFVRAAGLVAKTHPDVVFQIAGTGDKDSMLHLADMCGIRDRIELLGRVDNVPGFLSALDVAVLASRSEGLSNSLLEYMAAARPIVATSVGGNTELIRDVKEGLLVPTESPAALADAIVRLLDNGKLSCELGIAARRRVVNENGLDAMIRKYMDIYERLIDSSTRKRAPVTSRPHRSNV